MLDGGTYTLHQQTQQSDWCAVRSVSAGKWTKNQMHRRGEAIVQTIHWMQEVRILPVLIVITCVCTFPTCDHYCICIGVSFKLSANWNLWQTTDDRRREYRECGEIEFQAVTRTVLISSPGRMEAGMATVIIIQAGPGRCPLVQYLHWGHNSISTHGSGRVGDNYTVRPHSDTCPRQTRLPLGLPIHTQCHHPRSSCASSAS